MSQRHTVKIPQRQPGQSHRFEPAEIEVAKGDTVEWINEDGEDHTVTPEQAGDFEAKELAPGDRHTVVINADPGKEIKYRCDFHGSMKGTITVQASY
jgi:plastocyanin